MQSKTSRLFSFSFNSIYFKCIRNIYTKKKNRVLKMENQKSMKLSERENQYSMNKELFKEGHYVVYHCKKRYSLIMMNSLLGISFGISLFTNYMLNFSDYLNLGLFAITGVSCILFNLKTRRTISKIIVYPDGENVAFELFRFGGLFYKLKMHHISNFVGIGHLFSKKKYYPCLFHKKRKKTTFYFWDPRCMIDEDYIVSAFTNKNINITNQIDNSMSKDSWKKKRNK